MGKASRLNINNLLFSIFWWVIQKVSPKQGEQMLYWGLKSGAFPNRSVTDPVLQTTVMGMQFKTPIGIGSGFDIRANVIDDLIFMGAGFGEFGPYTLERETPTTEVYYLRKDRAIITQSLGCTNAGVLNILPRLINRRYLPNIIGVNLTSTAEFEGENVKLGRLMTYAEEFDMMTRKVAPYCDSITLDFSFPEVELAHKITDASFFVPLVKGVRLAAQEAAPIHPPKIMVKLPLGLTALELPLVCQNLVSAAVDAVIVAGPVYLSQAGLKLSSNHRIGMLAGAPAKRYVSEMVSKVYQFTNHSIPIIACGGVFSGQDAYEHIAAGASLVQVGTVLRFEGPNAITKINKELSYILQRKGLKSVSEAVGIDFY